MVHWRFFYTGTKLLEAFKNENNDPLYPTRNNKKRILVKPLVSIASFYRNARFGGSASVALANQSSPYMSMCMHLNVFQAVIFCYGLSLRCISQQISCRPSTCISSKNKIEILQDLFIQNEVIFDSDWGCCFNEYSSMTFQVLFFDSAQKN